MPSIEPRGQISKQEHAKAEAVGGKLASELARKL